MDIFPQYTTLCLCTGYSFCLKWPSLFCPIHHSRFSAKATRYSGQSHKLLFWGLTHLSFLNLCSALDISQCSLLKYFFSPLDCYMSEVKDWIPSSLTPKCLTCWLACNIWYYILDINTYPITYQYWILNGLNGCWLGKRLCQHKRPGEDVWNW